MLEPRSLIGPLLEWDLPPPLDETPRFDGFGLPVATLLTRRRFTDAKLRRLLEAASESLHPVGLMADADAALARIEAAVRARERIAVWGDYDADGLTAVAIWLLALRAAGADPLRYVPSRYAEGYGLSIRGLEQLRDAGTRLVITCDCGVSNVAEADHARQIGLELIVTDHHLPGARLPDAVAVVDPHRADCPYPDRELTGAGIAYRLASALLGRLGIGAADLAALAAIGTVADVAPLLGENRAIVRLGLAELATTRRAGLRALLARAGVRGDGPSARDLAFGVVPRVNAAGRIAEAETALALLIEDDEERAAHLADELQSLNVERQALTRAAVAAAQAMSRDAGGDGPLLLRSDAWPPGIIGLVAGRLADDLGRPVAAVTRVADELRGSVRAPADFHVRRALEACAGDLSKLGGHAAAGGFSVLPERLAAFAERWAALERPYPPDAAAVTEARRPDRVGVDLVLGPAHVGWELAEQLDRLAPFGKGHPEPILAVTGLLLADARRFGPDGRHLRFRLLRGYESLDAVAFGVAADRAVPPDGSWIDVVGTLERAGWEGEPRLRLRVLDFADHEASPIAARRRDARQRVAVSVG